MDTKNIIPLISVIIGWTLGQGTTLIRDAVNRGRIKRGLIEELHDIHSSLDRTQLQFARKIQISTIGGIEPSIPIQISNSYFNHFYKEIFPFLNSDQRKSYQLIHDLLSEFNDRIRQFTGSTIDLHAKANNANSSSECHEAILKWHEESIALYKNCVDIMWHIMYHINNSRSPKLDLLGPMHEAYIAFQKELDGQTEALIQDSKKFKITDFASPNKIKSVSFPKAP